MESPARYDIISQAEYDWSVVSVLNFEVNPKIIPKKMIENRIKHA